MGEKRRATTLPVAFALRLSPASHYQLALRTPGISPLSAISRKQIRQMPNFRMNARGRPQRPQRLPRRTENFGFSFVFSISAFLAIAPLGSR
jgi:hypothetical protein